MSAKVPNQPDRANRRQPFSFREPTDGAGVVGFRAAAQASVRAVGGFDHWHFRVADDTYPSDYFTGRLSHAPETVSAEPACCRQRRDCAAVPNQTPWAAVPEHERSAALRIDNNKDV